MPSSSAPSNKPYQELYRPGQPHTSSVTSNTAEDNTVERKNKTQSYMDYYRSGSDAATSDLTKEALEASQTGMCTNIAAAEHEDEAGSVVAEHGSDAGVDRTLPNIKAIIRQVGSKKGETDEENGNKGKVIIGELRNKVKNDDGEGQK